MEEKRDRALSPGQLQFWLSFLSQPSAYVNTMELPLAGGVSSLGQENEDPAFSWHGHEFGLFFPNSGKREKESTVSIHYHFSLEKPSMSL